MSDGRQNVAYWRDVILIGLGVLSVVASIGRILDWRTSHDPTDFKVAVGFLLLLPILFALSPRRFELLLGILVAIILFGIVGTVLRRSPVGLPLIVPCGLLAYVLLKWKGKQHRQ
jgi:hypothetical protein